MMSGGSGALARLPKILLKKPKVSNALTVVKYSEGAKKSPYQNEIVGAVICSSPPVISNLPLYAVFSEIV